MLKMKSIFVGTMAVLIAGTALAPSVMAAPGAGGRSGDKMGTQFFSNFDTDKNGTVTQAEIDAARTADFKRADAAGNGNIGLEEWKAFAATRSTERGNDRSIRMFQRFDVDGNGQVTRDEFVNQTDRMTARMGQMKQRMADRGAKMKDGKGSWGQGSRDGKQGKGGYGHHGMRGDGPREQGMFGKGMHGGKGMRGEMMGAMRAQIDLDRDGKISKDEMTKLADKLFANGPVDLAAFQKIATQFKQPMFVRSFQRLDTDGSLTVTQEEFFAPTAKMLDRMDRNNDGVITSADFNKMKKQWHKGQKDRKGGRDGQRQGQGQGQGQRG
ncbi:EF-hand domain-containing protein [Pseudovibrio sp. Tun.PSC04-5.I4]|uniref:EF-hand domain-containing protein n=1 Tax=Pseudovibrio sp. Tun.PSC04-5.I4 TaxID=1798213 RepID=UPI000885FAED|nr:EF-hand domain-containing protein [Pseudovibrio sp. Tun.PSC04-5.I4]SDQ87399.1 EF hand [Pseudovibrio sp. Tun.PSC04-5.I4]